MGDRTGYRAVPANWTHIVIHRLAILSWWLWDSWDPRRCYGGRAQLQNSSQGNRLQYGFLFLSILEEDTVALIEQSPAKNMISPLILTLTLSTDFCVLVCETWTQLFQVENGNWLWMYVICTLSEINERRAYITSMYPHRIHRIQFLFWLSKPAGKNYVEVWKPW